MKKGVWIIGVIILIIFSITILTNITYAEEVESDPTGGYKIVMDSVHIKEGVQQFVTAAVNGVDDRGGAGDKFKTGKGTPYIKEDIVNLGSKIINAEKVNVCFTCGSDDYEAVLTKKEAALLNDILEFLQQKTLIAKTDYKQIDANGNWVDAKAPDTPELPPEPEPEPEVQIYCTPSFCNTPNCPTHPYL